MNTGIYVHVPFCLKKCRYCDFISYPYRQEDAEKYLKGLLREIDMWVASGEGSRKICTVYIGGGTPTCLPESFLKEIIDKVVNNFDIEPGAEITIEANPGTVDRYMLQELLALGVNRVSLGVQACREEDLRVLGRIHSFQEAREAFNQARQAGFGNIGVDLIFGVPGQSVSGWLECLESIVAMGPEHISAYGLQIEEETPLYRDIERGDLIQCSSEDELEMFRQGIDYLVGAGYRHYEISNFARPGYECRHNLIYWNNEEYIGLGPAAHSYLYKTRSANEECIDTYAGAVEKNCFPIKWKEEISPELEMAETIFLALRMRSGLDLNQFYARFGRRLEDVYGERLNSLIETGWVKINNNRLFITDKGLPVANKVFMEFLP